MARLYKLLLGLALLWPLEAGTQILPGPILRTIGSTSTLNTTLTAYWKMDEASGTRADSGPSGENLTDNNTVTSNTGIISNAGQYTAANSESLSHTDDAVLSTGDIDYTIAVWVYIDDKTADRTIISRWSSSTLREYRLFYATGTDRFTFLISYNGTATGVTMTANTFGAVSTATWYLVIAWHDSINNIAGISVNDVADTSAYTQGSTDTTVDFQVGRYGSGFYMSGRIDEVGFWKKVLTSGERTELYNSGAGKTCCPF